MCGMTLNRTDHSDHVQHLVSHYTFLYVMTIFPVVCLTIYVGLSGLGTNVKYELGLHLTECDIFTLECFNIHLLYGRLASLYCDVKLLLLTIKIYEFKT